MRAETAPRSRARVRPRPSFVAAAAAAALAAMANPAMPEPRLDGGPWLPYRVNRAVLVDDAGIRGEIELAGRRWDGDSRLLFRARAGARSVSFPMAFYLDEETRSLELSFDGGEGKRSVSIAIDPPPPGEGLDRMRALVPPQRLATGRAAPATIALDGAVAAAAGARIAARLFVAPPPDAAIVALVLAALAAAFAAALPRRGARPRGAAPRGAAAAGGSRRSAASLGLAAAAAIGGAVAAAALASPPPALYRAELPLAEPSRPLWGSLERAIRDRGGWILVECRSAEADSFGGAETMKRDEGKLFLLGLATGRGRSLPLEALESGSGPIRLSAPPLVVSREGSFYVGSDDFLMGWAIDERD